MRIAQGTLIAAVLALAAAAPAPAAKYASEGYVQAGPVFAGSGTAWVDGGGDSMFVKRAPADAAPTTLFTVTRLATCDTIDDLAASSELVAVYVRRTGGDPYSNCNASGAEVLVSTGAGEPRALEDTRTSSCGPAAMDADGGLVAIARTSCRPASIVVHDVKAGTSVPLGFSLPEDHYVTALRLAGRYVAISMGVMNGSHAQVVVWDRELDKEAYKVDGGQLWDKMEDGVGAHIELHPDGRLLVASRTFGSESASVRYGWATPAEPTLHRIPGTYDLPGGRFAFAGALMAVPTAYGRGESVVGFDGVVTNPFSTEPLRESIDFDGSRLAWADRFHVYNEAYPYTAPKPEGPPTWPPPPVVKPPAARFAVPAAVVTVRSSVKAKALKAFKGTAADADGDLALVRVGLVRTAGKKCHTLQKSGRLKASKKVGGRCVPTLFQDAKGTATWKLKLRKRLPAGRYTIYAQAVDAAGHAQTAFTTAAGSMLTFKVRA